MICNSSVLGSKGTSSVYIGCVDEALRQVTMRLSAHCSHNHQGCNARHTPVPSLRRTVRRIQNLKRERAKARNEQATKTKQTKTNKQANNQHTRTRNKHKTNGDKEKRFRVYPKKQGWVRNYKKRKIKCVKAWACVRGVSM